MAETPQEADPPDTTPPPVEIPRQTDRRSGPATSDTQASAQAETKATLQAERLAARGEAVQEQRQPEPEQSAAQDVAATARDGAAQSGHSGEHDTSAALVAQEHAAATSETADAPATQVAADVGTDAADVNAEPVGSDGRAGVGGEWQTIDEQPGGAVGQILDDSCVSACGEMVSGRPQEQLIEALQDPDSWGASVQGLATELGTDWRGGYIDHPDAAAVLNTTGSWVAEMRTPGAGGASHAVVVDGTDEDGRMMIRDPWDGGTSYRMTGEEFGRVWTGVAVYNPTRTRETE